MLSYADQLTDPDKRSVGPLHQPAQSPLLGAPPSSTAPAAPSLSDDRASCTLTSPESQAGLQYIADLIFEHEVMPAPVTLQGQEKSLPHRQGRHLLRRHLAGRSDPPGRLRLGLRPHARPPRGPASAASRWAPTPGPVLSTSEHIEESWQLVKFLMGEGGQTGMMAKRRARTDRSRGKRSLPRPPPAPGHQRCHQRLRQLRP